jgi:hypothetical protein
MVNKNVVFQIEMGNVIFFRLHYTTIVRLETCENLKNILLSCSAKSLTEHKLVFRAFQSGLKTFVVVYLERTPTI